MCIGIVLPNTSVAHSFSTICVYSWNVNPTNSGRITVYTCPSTGSISGKDPSCYPVSELSSSEKYTGRYKMVVMSRKSQQISSEAARLAPTTMFATFKVSQILFLRRSDILAPEHQRQSPPSRSHTEMYCVSAVWLANEHFAHSIEPFTPIKWLGSVLEGIGGEPLMAIHGGI